MAPERNWEQDRTSWLIDIFRLQICCVQVVDTPGFGDSDNDDETLIEEMMAVLASTVDHADSLLLLLDGTDARSTAGLQTMLKRMTVMFGQDWWDYVVIGVSKWSFSQEAIDERSC